MDDTAAYGLGVEAGEDVLEMGSLEDVGGATATRRDCDCDPAVRGISLAAQRDR